MPPEDLSRILDETAGRTGFTHVLLEKDFYITRFLIEADRVFADALVMKGGTLLAKAYLGYRRMSEDVDLIRHASDPPTTRKDRSRSMKLVREHMREVCANAGLRHERSDAVAFNDNAQYRFLAWYDSLATGKPESIKIEVSVRRPVAESPVRVTLAHLFQDAVTGHDLLPRPLFWCLSSREAVAEKLRAALTREEPAIRDFYDLGALEQAGFDFGDEAFVALLAAKLAEEGFRPRSLENMGLTDGAIRILEAAVATDLLPLVRPGEGFDLKALLTRMSPLVARVVQRLPQ